MCVSIGVCEEGVRISNRRIYMIWRKTCWMAVGFIYMHFCVYGSGINMLIDFWNNIQTKRILTHFQSAVGIVFPIPKRRKPDQQTLSLRSHFPII